MDYSSVIITPPLIKICNKFPDAFNVFLHLLKEADDDGCATISVREMSRLLKIEYNKLRATMQDFETRNIISKNQTKSTQHYTTITVENIDSYICENFNSHAIPAQKPNEKERKNEDIKPKSFKCRATSIEEVQEEIDLKGYHISAREFFDYYEGSGWRLSGGKKVTDWKKCLVTWETRYKKEHAEETEIYRKNQRLLEQYDGDDKGYGGFIHYIADNTRNIIYAVEFPTEDQYRFINANHRSAIRNVLPMIDGDKFLSKTNFYTAFFNALKNLRLSGSDVTVESDEMDVEHIRDLWNEICVQQPRVEFISGTRLHNLSMRLSEMKGKIGIEEVFRAIANNAYLNGANSNGWVADFDWLVSNDTNWIKVIEGKYNNNDIVNKAKYDTIAQSQRARVEHETRGELLRSYIKDSQRESEEAERYVFTGEG